MLDREYTIGWNWNLRDGSENRRLSSNEVYKAHVIPLKDMICMANLKPEKW